MTHRGVLLAIVLLADARIALAQPSLATGVNAFAHGDYAQAAELLEPAVVGWPFGSPDAAFLMALMYENGLGVAANGTRACASYLRALANPALAPIADAQVQRLSQSVLSRAEFQDCLRIASIGFDHRFQPATFTLDGGVWVSVDIDGVTVSRRGIEQRSDLGLSIPGVLFLPTEHTELLTGPLRNQRRHFLEFFTWIPGEQGEWLLLWHVYEVRGLEIVPVTVRRLAVAPERPASASPGDTRRRAQLRVTGAGDVEWMVFEGAEQLRGRVDNGDRALNSP